MRQEMVGKKSPGLCIFVAELKLVFYRTFRGAQ